MGCTSSKPKTIGDDIEPEKSPNQQSQTQAKNAPAKTEPAKPKEPVISEEEKKRLEEEKRRKEEAEKKKAELDAKFTELCTEFVGLLSKNVQGEVSLEELRTVYGDKSEQLMKIADQDGDDSLSVEECKILFLKNAEPDCELVMQAIERIALVKEIREKRKLKEERERKRKAFEDACGDFVETLKKDLDDTITHEELTLVRKKPFEKYASVLYEADVRTVPGVMDAFTTEEEEFEIQEVIELTESFKEIKSIRESEKAFDAKLDEFFGELDGMDLQELAKYFDGNTKEVFDELDKNQDGQIDKSEMKPMFKLPTGYYDVDRLKDVREGLGSAAVEQHKATVEQSRQDFMAEVGGFKEVLAKATHPIDVEELKVVMPDNAEKFIGLCDPEATDETFQTTFAQGEMFDKPGLVHLKESVTHVLENRLKQFEEKLTSLEGKLVKSWLAKLKVDELSEQSPENAENYATIAAGSVDNAALRAMFIVDDIPQVEAFEIIYSALDAIEQKIMKKFYKSMDELIGFIGEYCNEESMGKFKRQDVFQVYIDETRVAEFDKRWVKKMLNKPIDDLPDKNELRELFTNKKNERARPQAREGFPLRLENHHRPKEAEHKANQASCRS
jgi:hypothetical protein